jgi:hypothetical protein
VLLEFDGRDCLALHFHHPGFCRLDWITLRVSHFLGLITDGTVPAYPWMHALFGDFRDGGMRPKID